MTIYMTRQVRLQAAQDASGQILVFRRGDRETKFNAVAALNEAGLSKLVIPIPTTDKDLMSNQEIAAGRVLYIETDTEILVKLALTGDTGITVKPISDADAEEKPGVLYLEGDFDHVYVTPAGASGNANIIFGIMGA